MKTILFGAGEMTIKFLDRDEFLQYDIQVIADNDERKHNTEFNHKGRCFKIISTKDIISYDYDIIIITIANLGYQLDISKQLVNVGIPASKIKVYRGSIIKDLPEIIERNGKEYPVDSIFFDTTNISRYDYKSGVQRVVRELYRHMQAQKNCVYPLQFINDGWITSHEFECRINNCIFDNKEYKVSINDELIFLPEIALDTPKIFKSIQHNRNSCAIIYDLIPILYPNEFSEKYNKQFMVWIEGILQYASKCICISKSVADDIINYYHRSKIERNNSLEIHTMSLGFDIPEVEERVREELQSFVCDAKTFLMVGTVNPRKNHSLLIESFKKVCEQIPDGKIQLLILGREGWMIEGFRKMYSSDKWIQERVLWIKDASDSEVQWAYQNCSALVYPPKTEGFGLPLVEAAHFRLPILCSDIPIFHEVVGDNADYFKVDDVDSLTEALIDWIRADTHPDSGRVKMHTWRECAAEVLDILNDKSEPYAVIS